MNPTKNKENKSTYHLSKLNPLPYLLTKSNSQPKDNLKTNKYATLGSKNNSLKPIDMEGRPSITISTPILEPQDEQRFLKTMNPKQMLEINNSLSRSRTTNSRSLVKVRSLNNLNEHINTTEEVNKTKKEKIRPMKSSFFKTPNTFSNMLPKMDFFKSHSYKEENIISRSLSENIKETKELSAEPIMRSHSEKVYTEEPVYESDTEKPSMTYLNNSAYDWINHALNEETFDTQHVFINRAMFSEISHQFYLYLNQNQPSWPKLFSGSEAIDILCKILNNEDRKLSLLIGRALDAQNFIFHVNQELRLRDSTFETYSLNASMEYYIEGNKEPLANGVFTLLTECYSPTCSDEFKCYSMSCPRRLNQMMFNEDEYKEDGNSCSKNKEEKLWENHVSSEILAFVSERERKRQEVIFEMIYTEQDFVDDLKVIQEVYLMPIHCEDILEESERDSFIEQVFLNVLEIQKASFQLSIALKELQDKEPIVNSIGKVFQDNIQCFEPFKDYGANQVYAKRRLAKEIQNSPLLEEFLKEQARLPECRKLPIQSFLARPTTRLGRYPLLLEAILKYTEEDNEDQELLPKVIQSIKDILSEINIRAGKADNRVKLEDLHKHLKGSPSVIKELDILNESRLLIREGTFKKKFGVENSDLFCFLLDNYFLMTKKRKSVKKEGSFEYKISKKPIRLDLLHLPDDVETTPNKTNPNNGLPLVTMEQGKNSFPLIITHLGKQGINYTLACSTQTERERWKNIILEQRNKILLKNMVFKPVLLANEELCNVNTVHCTAIYESKCTLLIGSDEGIYSKHVDQEKFELLLSIKFVTQIEVIEDSDLLIILSERILYYISLEKLFNFEDKREVTKIKNNIDFFSVGTCLDRSLICAVKSTALSTTFKIYQPANSTPKKGINTPKNFFSSFTTNSNQLVTFFKEFYIPSEAFNVYFLKSKICVACTRGFEVLDFNLHPQSLLDPSDENLNFVISRGETVKPIAFYRVKDGSFFVCFDEFGFYIDRAGKLDLKNKVINWYGTPKSFALSYPFLLAFSNNFIEVWNLEKQVLEQTILSNHIKALRTKNDTIHYVEQHLDKWQLNVLLLNKTNQSYLEYRKGLRSQRINKRRGIVGKDAL